MKRKTVVCNSTERIRECGRMKRWSVLLLVFGAFFLSLSALSPMAFAQPTALWIEESPFTHLDTKFVPGETIAIHIEGPEGDIYDVIEIYDPDFTPVVTRFWDNVTVPSGGEIVLHNDIPEVASMMRRYQVQVWSSDGSTLHLWADYLVVRFNAPVLEFILDLQDEIEDLTERMTSLEQNLSLLGSDISALQQSLDSIEGNITQLQMDIDNLQSTLSSIQTGLAVVIDDMDDLTSSMEDLQDQVEDLQADIANLEEKQASTSDLVGTNDLLTYLALVLGIAGLVIGLLAMFRKGPSHPQDAPIEQPIRQP